MRKINNSTMKTNYSMKIIENNEAKWTIQHIKHMKKYRKNYGVDITNEDLDKEIENIKSGNASLLCGNYDMRCFEVFINNDLVGNITITINQSSYELDIVIFDEYSNNGYATEVIRIFTSTYHEDLGKVLVASVLKENSNREKVKKILFDSGFEFERETAKGTWKFSKKLNVN